MARDLSEMVKQCAGAARGSMSPTFIPVLDRQAVAQEAAQDAGDGALHRNGVLATAWYAGTVRCMDGGDGFACLHHVADLTHAVELPGGGRFEQALDGVAADGAGDAGVGLRAALIVDAAQIVAPICLDDGVDILARLVAGTEGDDDGRVVHRDAAVVLGERGLDQYRWLELLHEYACGIDDDGYLVVCEQRAYLRERGGATGCDALDGHFAQQHGLGEGDGAAHHRWLRQFSGQHGEAGAEKAVHDAGGEIARAFYRDEGKLSLADDCFVVCFLNHWRCFLALETDGVSC